MVTDRYVKVTLLCTTVVWSEETDESVYAPGLTVCVCVGVYVFAETSAYTHILT